MPNEAKGNVTPHRTTPIDAYSRLRPERRESMCFRFIFGCHSINLLELELGCLIIGDFQGECQFLL